MAESIMIHGFDHKFKLVSRQPRSKEFWGHMRAVLFRASVWLAVIGMAAWFGGTLYQMSVIVPIWSASPPESVRQFFLETTYNQTIWNFFGPPFMAARILPVFVALALGWNYRRHRAWLLFATVALLSIILFTLFYVYPQNAVLFLQAGGDNPPEVIARMVEDWILADRVRFAIGTLVFLSLLRTLSLPLPNGRD